MESLGYYSNDTQLQGTLDTKVLIRQDHIESLVKQAYTLMKG